MPTPHPFSVLEAEYKSMLGSVRITRRPEVEMVAKKLLRPDIINQHIELSKETGVPALWYAVAFEREASSNFRLALGQGDPWNQVSTHVPRGLGPFASWKAAAAFYTRREKLDETTAPWTMAYACWKLEAWNGFGPRNRGRFTGYLWSGTSFYDPPTGKAGKYVADGKWDGDAVDKQLGCVPIMLTMIQMRPDLAFGPPVVVGAPVVVQAPAQPPIGVGGGTPDALWIQRAINKLGYTPPLVEDGNYGRLTRTAVRTFQMHNKLDDDGLVGPITASALRAALIAEFGNANT